MFGGLTSLALEGADRFQGGSDYSPTERRNIGTVVSVTRILVAEDDPSIRDLLSRALERGGYQVTATQDGLEAIEADACAPHDLLLLDVDLPGINGLEVCRQVRGSRQTVPIVFLTASSTAADVQRGFDAGATLYMTKPFAIAQLLTALRAQLRPSPDLPDGGRL